MTSASTADPLAPIMGEMAHFGSEFTGTFANHAPMVLVALDRIGGDADRLRDFFNHYRDANGLLPFGAVSGALDRTSWQTAIGQREREPDLRAFFQGEVQRIGMDEALRTYLPRLAAGVPASAFHALMRTAYAILRGNPGDTAIALGYWAATYLDLPGATGAAPITEDPAEVLTRVAAIEVLHGLEVQPLLWLNMRAFAQTAEFVPVVDWLAITPDTQRRMSAAAIALFAGTQEFAALHAVTGMHWLRIVRPYVANYDVMLRHFWQGIAGVMGEMGFPAVPNNATLDHWRTLPVPDWAEIKAKAARSYDEHDISLAFSASEEMAVWGDPLYQLAAARRVDLVPDYMADRIPG